MNWVENFYKKQFHYIKASLENSPRNYFQTEVQKITEQVGKQFTTILELGAGAGMIANELGAIDKQVTTVELVEELAAFAQKSAHPNVIALCNDFYTVELSQNYEVVLYLDGFGVGTDDEQLRLLKRIANWLTDDGYALIDIYEPNYWQHVSNTQMSPTRDPAIQRNYDYDEDNHRMTDTWWHLDDEQQKVTQSLACYTIGEIQALCEKADLQIVAYYPGGAMDYDNWVYHEVAALDYCISYKIKLMKK